MRIVGDRIRCDPQPAAGMTVGVASRWRFVTGSEPYRMITAITGPVCRRPRIIATAWEFVLSLIGLTQQLVPVRMQALQRLRTEEFGRRYERLLRWV